MDWKRFLSAFTILWFLHWQGYVYGPFETQGQCEDYAYNVLHNSLAAMGCRMEET